MPVEHQHAHRHPQGPVFEAIFPLWMLVGRGGMARTIAAAAGLRESDVVVDVGCGPGTAVRRARRAGARQVVGVDPNDRMLRLGRWITTLQRVKAADFLEGAAERLPLDSGSATVLWAIQSAHHWEDRTAGLQEARRVLAPGGRILLMERLTVPGARGLASHGITEHDAETLAADIAQSGFEGVASRTTPIGRRTFVLITATAPSS